MDDLDVPSLIHALDKSTFFPTLLHQVILDIQTLTVTCIFIDGVKEEWPLMDPVCVRALESVVHDINQSSLEDDQEADQQRWAQIERERSLSKPVKHKKQRSLLMSLVASV